MLVGTAGTDGGCEVSPRGGPPGFVQVLDEQRLAIPDLSGNNLLDSISNVVRNPYVGLLFVLPGRDETLRVNGRAWLTTDDAVLDGFTAELKRPKAAIGVEVVDAFVHCAKSFRRGQVWDPATWAPEAAPSAAELLTCHIELEATPAAARRRPRGRLRPRPGGRASLTRDQAGTAAARRGVLGDHALDEVVDRRRRPARRRRRGRRSRCRASGAGPAPPPYERGGGVRGDAGREVIGVEAGGDAARVAGCSTAGRRWRSSNSTSSSSPVTSISL